MYNFILKLVVVLFVICGSVDSATNTSFALDDFLNHTYSDKKWDGKWIDDKHFLLKRDEGYVSYNAETKKTSLVFSAKDLKNYKGPIVIVSENHTYGMIKYNVEPVYRHSTLANYNYFKIGSKPTLNTFAAADNLIPLQYAQFYPHNDSIIFIKDNNIYYRPNLDKSATAPKVVKITTDGKPNVIYNGIPDWVYEEEVLASDKALWMSPKSHYVVYAKFDDTAVKSFMYYKYGKPGSMEDQYPKTVNVHYPKVGTPNPKFSLHAFNMTTSTTTKIDLNFGQKSENYILYDVTWKTNVTILVTYTNRLQNEAFTEVCNVDTGKCNEFKTLNYYGGWIDVQSPLLVPKGVIQVLPVKEYDSLLYFEDGAMDEKNFEVGNKIISKLYGERDNLIYFEATESSNHSQQHVYTISLQNQSMECLTCNFKTPEGFCKFAKAEFSTQMSFMTKICLGPGPSYVEIVDLRKNVSTLWEDNADLRKALNKTNQPIVQDLMVPINGGGRKFEAAVRLLKPPNFDEKQKYPMLVNVYAGPNSKQIQDTYSIGLEHYLVTNKSYIYALIDGRGSAKRGRALMTSVYRKLGQFEIDDQISTTKFLRKNFTYIDPNRICIWGWSYGGFATAWAIARDKEVFKCGVSVAPVTDFIYYDSIYTERYMGLPNDNLEGYNKTDLTRVPESFRGKNFLLVHGNADDNVHYQQSMMLARSLELADVQFEQLSYPDENHSLRGVLRHLYHSLDRFWDRNLKGNETDKSSGNKSDNDTNKGFKHSYHLPAMFMFIANAVNRLIN